MYRPAQPCMCRAKPDLQRGDGQIPFWPVLGDGYLGLPLLRLPPDFSLVVLGHPPASPGPLPVPAPGRASPPLELPPVALCRAPGLAPPPLLVLPLVPLLLIASSSKWRLHGRTVIVNQPYPMRRKEGLRTARADHEPGRRAAGAGRRHRYRARFQIAPSR